MEKPSFILITNTRGSVWQRSIGAYQVAHHCRKNGFNTQVIDFVDFFTDEELLTILDGLYSDELLAIGVSTTFYTNISEGTNPLLTTNASSNLRVEFDTRLTGVLVKLKNKYPKIKLIAGGANSWQMLDNPVFDAVFHGYSEISTSKYLESLRNKKRVLYATKNNISIINGDLEKFDIENLDHMWTDNDLVLPEETLPIEIARGCIFNCKFCSYPLNGKKKYDYVRNVNAIREELLNNYNKWGTTNYFFADDTFNDTTDKIIALHKIFTELPFKINFVCYLRVDLLMRFPEQIQLLKEMGLRSVVFGIESMHHGAAKAIGKGVAPDKIKKFLLDLYYNQWEKQVSITCSMIIGLPGESIEHCRETFNWFRTEGVDLCDSWWPLTINTNGHYKSQFELEFDKFNYQINETGDSWTSPTMTYGDALKLSEEFNSVGMLSENRPGSWMIMALRSYGFSQSELMSWQVKNMPWKTLLKKRLQMAKIYKNKLFALVENFNT